MSNLTFGVNSKIQIVSFKRGNDLFINSGTVGEFPTTDHGLKDAILKSLIFNDSDERLCAIVADDNAPIKMSETVFQHSPLGIPFIPSTNRGYGTGGFGTGPYGGTGTAYTLSLDLTEFSDPTHEDVTMAITIDPFEIPIILNDSFYADPAYPVLFTLLRLADICKRVLELHQKNN